MEKRMTLDLNSLAAKILREEIRRKVDQMFESVDVGEFVGKFPRVQTHASPTKDGLSSSVRRTMVSRLISIPVGQTRLIPTVSGLSDRDHAGRIRGHSSWLKRGHGVRISVKVVEGGANVTRLS